MKSYIEFEIQEGAYDISCPDAQCEKQGVISLSEIEILVSKELVEKHSKFRLNRGKQQNNRKGNTAYRSQSRVTDLQLH
jgi:hypothetical protein